MLTTLLASLALLGAHHHPQHHHVHHVHVAGLVSTFGPPLEGVEGTADGGNTERACIAVRHDSTLDHTFRVRVFFGRRYHQANMPQCDWGPASWTGRSIDITGEGSRELHINPWSFPTENYATADEVR